KILRSLPGKVESEPPHGSNVDISKIHECKQTLDLSAGDSQLIKKTAMASIDNTSGPTPLGK
ncbi:hypothetical protein Tco_0314299, partial [Tanacetum coccineum]